MKLEKSIHYTIIGGLFLIPFIPLIVSNTLFFPFITGKGFTFRVIVEVLTALWLILIVIDRKYAPRKSWITLLVSLFLGITLIADIFGANPLKSIWSNYERMEGWVTILHLALYFMITGVMLNSKNLWKWYLNTFLGVSAILCIYGFFQSIGKLTIHQGDRLDATLGNSAYLAVFMLVSIFITAFMFLREKKWSFFKWAYLVLGIAEGITLYETQTRGSAIGFFVGLVVWSAVVMIFEKTNKKLQLTATISFGVLAILTIFFGFVIFNPSFRAQILNNETLKSSPALARFASINLDSGAARFQIWNMAFQGFKEKPLIGWGQENFNYVFNKYYIPSMYSQEQWFDRAHDVFFDWLIAGGILGLLSYLSLFGVAFWYIWRRNGNPFSIPERATFTALLVAYFIHNIFVFDNLVSYILFFTLLAFLHVQYENKPLAFVQKIKIHKDIQNLVVIPAIVVVFLIVFYQADLKPMWASNDLIQAISPQAKGISANLDYFKQSLALNTFGNQEIREQLVATSEQVASANTTNEIKNGFFTLTKDQMDKQIAATPNDARAYFFMASYLDRAHLYTEAAPYIAKAVSLSPTKQTMLFELGTNYLAQQNFDQGLATFKQAYELDKTYDEARIDYAVAAIYADQSALAEQLLGTKDKALLTTDQRFINAYAVKKQYSKLLSIYSAKLKADPKDSQTRVSLAAVYLAMGERAAAIEQIQAVIDQDPTFKDQGNYYISEIRAGRNP